MAGDLHRASEREKEREREAFLRYEGKAGRVERKRESERRGSFGWLVTISFVEFFLYVI